MSFEFPSTHVAHRIRWREPTGSLRLKSLTMPCIDKGNPWGFFDRASQGVPGLCGAGMALFIDTQHYFCLNMLLG